MIDTPPVALVTGASSGMGREIARELARTHQVIAVGRNAERLEALGAELGDRGEIWRLDLVRDAAQVGARASAQHRLDVLVHAAAISPHRSVAEAHPEEWQEVLATNVSAPAELTRHALPLLRRTAGTIIFIGSGAGTRPVPGSALYTASKHALRGVADVLRIDEEPHRVRVVTVAPGQTDTPMLRAGMPESEYRPELYIQPSSVARTVRFVVDAPADAQITDVAVRPRRELARL